MHDVSDVRLHEDVLELRCPTLQLVLDLVVHLDANDLESHRVLSGTTNYSLYWASSTERTQGSRNPFQTEDLTLSGLIIIFMSAVYRFQTLLALGRHSSWR